MSRREDLETQVVTKIKTVSALALPSPQPAGTFNVKAAAAVGFTVGDPPFPSVRVVCQRFKGNPGQYEYQFGIVRVIGYFEIEVYLRLTKSGPAGAARLGVGGGYDLAQQIDAALNGLQPVLDGAEWVNPMVVTGDEMFDVSEVVYETVLSYRLDCKLVYQYAT